MKYKIFVLISRQALVDPKIYEFDTYDEAELAYENLIEAVKGMNIAYSIRRLYKEDEEDLPINERILRVDNDKKTH